MLVALQGSALREGETPWGDPRLTQRALVERTGIRAPRISTLVKELNATAAARLDAYAPAWRSQHPGVREARLVARFRGSVAGQPGVWVYYRLTPLGETLAEAIAGDSASAPGGRASEAAADEASDRPSRGGATDAA